MILKSHRGLPRFWMVIVSVCLIFAGPLSAEVPREKKGDRRRFTPEGGSGQDP